MENEETWITNLLLNGKPEVIERAILALHKATVPELGFDETDIVFGTYLASWVINKKKITGTFLLKARLMMIKYRFQLLAIIKEKGAKLALKLEASRKATRLELEAALKATQLGSPSEKTDE